MGGGLRPRQQLRLPIARSQPSRHLPTSETTRLADQQVLNKEVRGSTNTTKNTQPSYM